MCLQLDDIFARKRVRSGKIKSDTAVQYIASFIDELPVVSVAWGEGLLAYCLSDAKGMTT